MYLAQIYCMLLLLTFLKKSYTLSLILHQSCRSWKGKNRNSWHKIYTGLHEVEFCKSQMFSWILTLPVLLGSAQTELQRDSWLKVSSQWLQTAPPGTGPCRHRDSEPLMQVILHFLLTPGSRYTLLTSCVISYCMSTPDSLAAASGSRNGARSSPSSCLYALPVGGLTVPYLCLEPWFGGLNSERGK